MIGRVVDWEASSRLVGLLRIFVALDLWATFAARLRLDPGDSWAGVLLAVNFFAATSLFLIGLHTRYTAWWAGLSGLALYYGLGLVDGQATYVHHHTYVLVAFAMLLALTPCGRSFSVDRWRWGEPERGPMWGLVLIRLQFMAMYLWAAYDKSFWGFLSGERMEMMVLRDFYGSTVPDAWWFGPLMVGGAVGTVAIEYALPFTLWSRRLRLPSMAVGALMHLVIYLTFPVHTFTVTTLLLYAAFFDPEDVHRVIDRMLSGQPAGDQEQRPGQLAAQPAEGGAGS